jgi:membrane-anchored glycerophosphoryl diester phosphodiesterase (GDPDase)
MSFCPKFGVTLGPLPPRARREKEEKHEKRGKIRKDGKKRKERVWLHWPLIGGLILIVVGLMAYLATISPTYVRNWGPILLIAFGAIILVITIYAAMTAVERSPKPS